MVHGPLRDHVELVAVSKSLGGEVNERILQRLLLSEGRWVAL